MLYTNLVRWSAFCIYDRHFLRERGFLKFFLRKGNLEDGAVVLRKMNLEALLQVGR